MWIKHYDSDIFLFINIFCEYFFVCDSSALCILSSLALRSVGSRCWQSMWQQCLTNVKLAKRHPPQSHKRRGDRSPLIHEKPDYRGWRRRSITPVKEEHTENWEKERKIKNATQPSKMERGESNKVAERGWVAEGKLPTVKRDVELWTTNRGSWWLHQSQSQQPSEDSRLSLITCIKEIQVMPLSGAMGSVLFPHSSLVLHRNVFGHWL